jgi:hypothetical protein
MKQTFWILIVLLLSVTLFACSQDSAGSSKSNEEISVSYPAFSYPASEEPFLRGDISFDIAFTQTSKLEESVKIYRAKDLTLDDAYKRRILGAFGFQNYSNNVEETNVTNYNMDNKQISIYPNGVFTFETAYETDRKEFPFNIKDEDVGQNAQKFLESCGLMPSGFVLTNKFGEQGVTYEVNGTEQTVVTAKGAWFQRIIDGIEVVGTSKILVMLNPDGICSVTSAYSELGEATEINLIGMEEAVERAKTIDSLLNWELNKLEGSETKAVVNQVKIVYYDDPLDESATHVQPCYYFEGTARDELNNETNFSILVPALEKEKYLNKNPR